jgi:hypothetical protein
MIEALLVLSAVLLFLLGYSLYPFGLFFCHFQESWHISSSPLYATQFNSFCALVGFA